MTWRISTDGNLTANSDALVPSQSATKTAIADAIAAVPGGGNVTRTGATTDNKIVRWDSTTATIQTSGVTIDDSDNVSGIKIDAGSNTVTNIATSMFAANVVDTDTTLAANSDTRLASQKAVKTYVDQLISGLQWKPGCVVRTTANITLSGEQTIDGVLTSASRVLVMAQTAQTENGIYVSGAGAWTRAADGDTGTELVNAAVFVEAGTTYAHTQWTCTNTTIVLGVTSIAFAQVSGAGTYTGGAGITVTGTSIAITSYPALSGAAITGILNTNITGLGNLSTQNGTFSGTSSGTNTGDQTLPVKATGAELDTGTDDAKFATAKALKDSHNVPSVAPSTSGKLLTSDGTDWTSAAQVRLPSTAGVAASPSATQTDTITHSLGRVPKVIRIYGMSQFTSNASAAPAPLSTGIWCSSGNFCIYQAYNTAAITTTQNAATSSTFAVNIQTAANSFVTGIIQNVGATTFDIAWTETGTASAKVLMWEAE